MSWSATSIGSAIRTAVLPECCCTGRRPAARKRRALLLAPRPSGRLFCHRVEDLDACLMGGTDQPGDVVQGPGRPGLLGQFGQRAAGAHHALLALHRQQHGGRGTGLFG